MRKTTFIVIVLSAVASVALLGASLWNLGYKKGYDDARKFYIDEINRNWVWKDDCSNSEDCGNENSTLGAVAVEFSKHREWMEKEQKKEKVSSWAKWRMLKKALAEQGIDLDVPETVEE